MGLLEQIRVVDSVLTQLAWGYADPAFVAEALFPIVNVDKESAKIPTFGKEAFYDYATERAIRGDSNVAPPRARSTTDIALVEHDFADPIDYREISEDVFNREQESTMYTLSVINRRRERLAAGAAQTTGNYASGHYATLSGTTQFSHADSPPIATIETAKEVVRTAIGVRPNVLLMGAVVYKTLKDHGDLTDRIKYSMKGVVTPDLMAEIFGIPKVVVADSIYSTDAGVMTDIWSDSLVMAYVPEAPGAKVARSMYRPSFGYTFRKSGWPQVDKYIGAGGKVTNVRSTDIFLSKIVGSTAGYLMLDCIA